MEIRPTENPVVQKNFTLQPVLTYTNVLGWLFEHQLHRQGRIKYLLGGYKEYGVG